MPVSALARHRLRRTLTALAVVLAVAAPCVAEPMAYRAVLSLDLLGLGSLAGSGVGVAEVGPGPLLGPVALAGPITAQLVVPVTDPVVSVAGMIELRVSAAVGPGALGLSPFGQALDAAALAVPGAARLCLFYAGCNSGSIGVPFTQGGTRGVGLGGTVAVASPQISLLAAPWTIHTAEVSLPVSNGASLPLRSFGFVHGPLSFAFSAQGTWNGAGGEIQLVTPLRIDGLGDTPAAGFARLHLAYLPEPRRLAWACGAALLLWLARRAAARSSTPAPNEDESPCSTSYDTR